MRLSPDISRAFLSYAGVKAAAFFAPLLLAVALPAGDYGLLEYCLAIAAAVAIPFGMGMSIAAPYFLLKRAKPEYRSALFLHALVLTGVWASGVSLRFLGVISPPHAAIISLAVIFCVQALEASLAKCDNRPAVASLLESALFVAVILLLSVAEHTAFELTVGAVFNALDTLSFLWLLSMLIHWARIGPAGNRTTVERYLDAARYGVPLLVPSVLMVTFAGSGRIISGWLLGYEDAAVFALLFRVASCVILIHQFLGTFLFRTIYTSEGASLDRIYARILALIASAALVLAIFVPLLVPRFFAAVGNARPFISTLSPILSLYMVYWAASAQLEGILYRENMGARMVTLSAGALLVVTGPAVLLSHIGHFDLVVLTFLQVLGMLTIVAGQVWSLRQRGATMRLSATVLAAATALFALLWLIER